MGCSGDARPLPQRAGVISYRPPGCLPDQSREVTDMRSYILLAVLAALLALAAACNSDSSSTARAPFAEPAVSPGHTEILYAIGAGDQVAAVDNTSDCPSATNDLPKVDAFTPSVEQIAGLEPDLVVIFFDPGDLQSALQAIDIPVLNLAAPESVQGVYDQVALLGKATGHADDAATLVSAMESAVQDVLSRLIDESEA